MTRNTENSIWTFPNKHIAASLAIADERLVRNINTHYYA